MAAVAARQVGCRSGEVLIASTGVIGEPLPLDQIFRAEEKLGDHLGSCSWKRAAEAISTTDTFPKGAFATCDIGSKRVRIAGIAKGSGMIAPDMATMLGFIFTDAQIPQQLLQPLLVRIAGRTFNSITVDGDTSTSDTLVLAATGRAGNTPPLSIKDSSLSPFVDALEQVARDLATQIVKDGEGATKFIMLEISGATSFQAARRVGLSIGNSPLVKTAIAGEDANWGRIVMAVGKAGERADRDQLEITIGGVAVVRAGERVIDYQEEPVADHLKGQEIQIGVDLGVGRGSATVWTCDLTHGYISINADYRS
jgi:glutamate N-acetyltransferase/amino-acid N-acetyltransferase